MGHKDEQAAFLFVKQVIVILKYHHTHGKKSVKSADAEYFTLLYRSCFHMYCMLICIIKCIINRYM